MNSQPKKEKSFFCGYHGCNALVVHYFRCLDCGKGARCFKCGRCRYCSGDFKNYERK